MAPLPQDRHLSVARLLVWLVLLSAAAGLGLTRYASRLPVAVTGGLFAAEIVLTLGTAFLLYRARLSAPPRDTLLKERTLEDVEKQMEAIEEQNRQIRASYREVAHTLREKQAAHNDLALGMKWIGASLEDADAGMLSTRLLRDVMEMFGASGAVLWLADDRGEQMEVCAVEGQIAPILRDRPVAVDSSMQPSNVRRACEERLRSAAPLAPVVSASPPSSNEDILDPRPDAGRDVLATVLRDGGRLFGVAALSGAKGGRFREADAARLAAFAPTITLALKNVERRARQDRSLREMSLLYEMSGLVQATIEPEELYEALVEQVGRMVSFENCTVFVFDPEAKRLIAKATRGRVVNLMDHIPFEHGGGISGWVAEQRKQLFIADLTRETGLLNVEMIPPRIRSFVSVPMIVEERAIGVLNVSHSQPNAFSREDARLLSTLAAQGAMAIERHAALRPEAHTTPED